MEREQIIEIIKAETSSHCSASDAESAADRILSALVAENAARDAAVRGLVEVLQAIEPTFDHIARQSGYPVQRAMHARIEQALTAYAEAAKPKETNRG